jgi:hypothetical protein
MWQRLIILLLVFSCKSENFEMGPSGSVDKQFNASDIERGLFGVWKLSSYEDLKNIRYDVTLELKTERTPRGLYLLSGKSAANFYNAQFEFNNQKGTIKIYDLATTEINADATAKNFEVDFWKRLLSVEKFQIIDNVLTISLKENKKLIFKK